MLPFFRQSEEIPSHLRQRYCLESWPTPKSFIHPSRRFERDWFWCSWDATRFQKLRCLPKHNWRLKHKDMRRHSFHSKGSVWSWGCIQSMFLLQISISLWHTDKHFHMSSLTEISVANFALSFRFLNFGEKVTQFMLYFFNLCFSSISSKSSFTKGQDHKATPEPMRSPAKTSIGWWT